VVAIEERELFTENVMMGVYTGRLFRASWPGFEDFGILSHLDQPKHVCTQHSIAIRNFFSIEGPPQMVNSVHFRFWAVGMRRTHPTSFGPMFQNSIPYPTIFCRNTHILDSSSD
jgi:hypothetical protein